MELIRRDRRKRTWWSWLLIRDQMKAWYRKTTVPKECSCNPTQPPTETPHTWRRKVPNPHLRWQPTSSVHTLKCLQQKPDIILKRGWNRGKGSFLALGKSTQSRHTQNTLLTLLSHFKPLREEGWGLLVGWRKEDRDLLLVLGKSTEPKPVKTTH